MIGVSVSKTTIVEASITILNRDGIKGLSMRNISKELGIKAASLYNHISGKTELYDEIAEYMSVHFELPEASLGAEEYLVEAAKSFRSLLLTVRDSVVIFEDSAPVTPYRLAVIKRFMEKFIELGVCLNHLTTVANMWNNYILSFTADELRMKDVTPDDMLEFAHMLDMAGDASQMSFPNFDEQFSFGLHLLLAGIRQYNTLK